MEYQHSLLDEFNSFTVQVKLSLEQACEAQLKDSEPDKTPFDGARVLPAK
jgi:hypothetical protein